MATISAGPGVTFDPASQINMGQPGGAAGPLDPAGKVPAAQIPPLGANPSVTVGLTAKNGAATTYVRSDGAPAIDQSIAPTWTGEHTFAAPAVVSASGTNPKPSLAIKAAGPSFDLWDTAAGADAKRWNMVVSAGKLFWRPVSDAGIVGSDNLLTAERSGTTITGVQTSSGSGSWAHTGGFSATKDITASDSVGSIDEGPLPNLPGSSGSYLYAGNGFESLMLQRAGNSAGNRRAYVGYDSVGLSIGFFNDQLGTSAPFITGSGGGASGISGITSTSGSGSWAHTGSFTVNGNSFPPIVASGSQLAQSADVNQPSFYAVPASGLYRISAFVVLSRAATTSSTLPGVSVSYTEATTGTAVQDIMFGTGGTGNTVGLHQGGSIVIQAQQGANIGYITTGYASSGATSMQFAVTVKVEAIQ